MKRRKFISNLSSLGIISVATPPGLFFAQPSTYGNSKVAENSVRLIRNATLVLEYAGKKILIDPFLSAKGAYEPFAGGERNPTVELPVPVEEIINKVDLVLVTHTHLDHFDPVAKEALPADIKMFYQPANEEAFKKEKFTRAEAIEEVVKWNGIQIFRTGGKHGSGEIGKKMGSVSGFVLKAENQPTVYIIGDSIWTEEVEQALIKYKPDVIVANTGGAKFPGFEDNPILMDEDQAVSLIKASGKAKIIAVHMEALDHCHTTRNSLQQKAEALNLNSDKLHIPLDGEKISF